MAVYIFIFHYEFHIHHFDIWLVGGARKAGVAIIVILLITLVKN